MTSPLLPPQDKAFHSVAAPAPGTAGVQAQWRDEGVPGERPFTADPHGAPPLGAGPQVTEGPAGGAALPPEAGRGQGCHQGLCPIDSQTSGCHRDEKGQVTEDGPSLLLLESSKTSWGSSHLGSKHSSTGFRLRNKPWMEDAEKSSRGAHQRWKESLCKDS